jgi:hypothetical protein
MAEVYIVYHSSYGLTKLQAKAVNRGAVSIAEADGRQMAEITQR